MPRSSSSRSRSPRLRVAVLCGGESAERAVSLASGLQVYEALRARGHAVLAVDTAQGILRGRALAAFRRYRLPAQPPVRLPRHAPGHWLLTAQGLRKAGVDVVFVALHGGAGENGTVQAVLASAGLAHTGSDHRACALATDKQAAKQLFRAARVPTPDWQLVTGGEAPAPGLGWPRIVKPRSEGSTVGLSLVAGPRAWPAAVAKARRHGATVLAERFVAGRELTVGVLEGRALAVGEIVLGRAPVFDYGRKYGAGRVREVFPAALTRAQTRRVQALAERAADCLGLWPYARADFRMDRAGRFWCLEVNALPGLTAASLFPQSAAAAGISFVEVCERLVRGARGEP